jgi:hypothetical protein
VSWRRTSLRSRKACGSGGSQANERAAQHTCVAFRFTYSAALRRLLVSYKVVNPTQSLPGSIGALSHARAML